MLFSLLTLISFFLGTKLLRKYLSKDLLVWIFIVRCGVQYLTRLQSEKSNVQNILVDLTTNTVHENCKPQTQDQLYS